MIGSNHIEQPDLVLIGSGIMSATLGAILKRLDPSLRIQLYEVTDEVAQEASHGWNNAGTGHAGLCELSYTPQRHAEGRVDVTKAITVFEEFEQSKQFWAHAVGSGMIDRPQDFIRSVPHISFVHGQEHVDFLASRHAGLAAHHFFRDMEFTEDPEVIQRWAPLLIEGREAIPVAATKMDSGTDVNFGVLAQKLVTWLSQQPDCGVATGHRVTDLQRIGSGGWEVHVRDRRADRSLITQAKFVFLGAGGGSLPLLQKSGIAESKAYGGFPIGGQWLVCENPNLVAKHQAKVYGQAFDDAPAIAAPHLDARTIEGKQALLFGPFATWTSKFLHRSGSWLDLPRSLRWGTLGPLARVGLSNLPLIKYLIRQGTQSMAARMRLLKFFYPTANPKDWKLVDAGIRVQAIKMHSGEPELVLQNTELVTSADKTLAALLGASPGASVSVSIGMKVVATCLPHLLESDGGRAMIRQLIPSYGKDLMADTAAPEYLQLSQDANRILLLED